MEEILHRDKNRIWYLMKVHKDFPKPVAKLRAGRVWERSKIEKWYEKHPDQELDPGKHKRHESYIDYPAHVGAGRLSRSP
jgi:predicted DNA-binding transcriptional regulator AlpA